MLSLSYKDADRGWGHTDSLLTILLQALRCPRLWLSRPPLCGLKYVCVCGNCEKLTKIVHVSVAGKGLQEKTNRRRDCTCTHVCVSGGGLSEPRHGTCYLFLILALFCGFPAVTGQGVETGTNEQLHPACLPGIMGLQADRASVCAPFLHSHFVIPLPSLCSRLSLLSDFSHSVVQLSFSNFSFPWKVTHCLFLILLTRLFIIISFSLSLLLLFLLLLAFSPFDFMAASHSLNMLSLTAEEWNWFSHKGEERTLIKSKIHLMCVNF